MMFDFTFYLYFLSYFIIFLTTSSCPLSSHVPNCNYVGLACGLLQNATATDGRNWTADTNSPFFSPHQNNASAASAEHPASPMFDSVPFNNARISRFQFTYQFPVTPGTQFIRLHFYPASYKGFNNSTLFFSVKADSLTLLDKFDATNFSKAIGFEVFRRELWVDMEDSHMLDLTFLPGSGVDGDVYAFINGIETMSVPNEIYDTAASNPQLRYLGHYKPTGLQNKTAVELMYRLNVGGPHIPPIDDTVLFRCWLCDDQFLTGAKSGVTSSNSTINLKFSEFTRFAAPEVLYRTGRSIGIEKTVNKTYNLTWEFRVFTGFTYFIRLYFCEFQPEITQDGDRVFQIYIDNKIAEPKADIIYWSGGNGIPVYKDYAVTIGTKGNEKVQNLSISLIPVLENHKRYSNAMLNGIEIFKSVESEMETMSIYISKKPWSVGIKIVAIVGGAVLGFVLLPLLFFLIVRRKVTKGNEKAKWWRLFVSSTGNNTIHSPYLPGNLCRRFSLKDIKSATKNFDSVCIIGIGGFGKVYKGTIKDGATKVAIKRLSPGSEQGANEFKTEIEMLTQLRHRHLVSLIGYCCEDSEMILVYDYLANGSLSDHLYNTGNPSLQWKQRLEICIGAARGLRYLHSEAKNAIIHRDVKSTNILLDENWVAKVSDFGLSKMWSSSNSKTHIITTVKGSYGYLDPEYYRRQQLTEKSDVYSFGVVLFEVLCARPALDRRVVDDYDDQVSLAVWARECYCNGTLYQIIDPFLKGKIAPECFKIFSEIAVSCLLDERIKRPSMSEVVSGLELALRLQEIAEDNLSLDGDHMVIDFDLDMPFNVCPDIISLLNTSTDESYSNISIDCSNTNSNVEV